MFFYLTIAVMSLLRTLFSYIAPQK